MPWALCLLPFEVLRSFGFYLGDLIIWPMSYTINTHCGPQGQTHPLYWHFGGPNRVTRCCNRTRWGFAEYEVVTGPFNNSQGWHNTSAQHIFVEIFLVLTGAFKDQRADLSQLLCKMWLIYQPVEIEVKPVMIAVGNKGWTHRLNSIVFRVCQGKEDCFFFF